MKQVFSPVPNNLVQFPFCIVRSDVPGLKFQEPCRMSGRPMSGVVNNKKPLGTVFICHELRDLEINLGLWCNSVTAVKVNFANCVVECLGEDSSEAVDL